MSIECNTDKENIAVYADDPELTRFARKVWRTTAPFPGTHVGEEYSEQCIESRPTGGGVNGPTSADYGLTISVRKKGLGTGTAVTGEIDGLNVVVCNDGQDTSDAGGILTNVANLTNGFTVCYEGVSSAYASPPTYIMRQVRYQLGVTDLKNSHSFGINVSQCIGVDGDAYRCDTNPGKWWTNFLNFYNDGVQKFTLDGNGVVRAKGLVISGPSVSAPAGISFGGVWSYVVGVPGTITLPKAAGFVDVNIGGTGYLMPYFNKP